MNVHRGVTTVEFSIVSVIIFMVVFACIEFSRVNLIRHTANQAAYDAARHTIVPGASSQEAIQRANSLLAQLGIINPVIRVIPDTITEQTTSVSVEIDIPLQVNGWGLMSLLGANTLTAKTELLTERAPIVLSHALPTPPPSEPPPSPPGLPPPPSEPPPLHHPSRKPERASARIKENTKKSFSRSDL